VFLSCVSEDSKELVKNQVTNFYNSAIPIFCFSVLIGTLGIFIKFLQPDYFKEISKSIWEKEEKYKKKVKLIVYKKKS